MYKVLFICKHNAGRSVLAESIATNILPADFSVTSGGSHPTGKVHPVVQKYLDDHQLPIPAYPHTFMGGANSVSSRHRYYSL